MHQWTRKKKKKKKVKEEKKLFTNDSVKNNKENSTNEFTGVYLYANDKKGSLKKISIEESYNDNKIRDIDKEQKISKNKDEKDEGEDDGEKKIVNNPFKI